MTTPPHRDEPLAAFARYRSRLQAAEDPAVLARLFGPGWTRHAARFEPWRQPWATLILQRSGTEAVEQPRRDTLLTVTVYDAGSDPPGARPSELGPLLAVPLSADHSLLGLASMLTRWPHLEVVRYRPGRRCTLRLSPADRHGDAAAFVKLFDAASAAGRIHREAQRLWAAAERGELPFAVARPGEHDVDRQAVWQHQVAGEPIGATLAGPGAAALCARLGAALGALAVADVKAETRIDATAQIARTGRAVAKASSCGAETARRVSSRWQQLQSAHATAGPGTVGVVHGSPHSHQWLDDGERLGLVDFDRLGYGDVELDAATFLAELDFDRACRDRVDELAEALCEGYASAGIVLDRRLVQLYRFHKWLSKVGRTAGALRADGDVRVLQLLDRFDGLVETTP